MLQRAAHAPLRDTIVKGLCMLSRRGITWLVGNGIVEELQQLWAVLPAPHGCCGRAGRQQLLSTQWLDLACCICWQRVGDVCQAGAFWPKGHCLARV